MAQVVPIDAIVPWSEREPPRYFLNKMKLVLCQQGQIEPLQASRTSHRIHGNDVHGDTIWYAAKELGWDTILVVFNERYEE